MRPGRSGRNSCFSFVRVLKMRSGTGRLFRGSKRHGRRHLLGAHARSLYSGWSAVEDRFQVALDVVLVDALGEGKLLDQEVARGVEHLALAEAQVLVELEQVEVAQHFGDLEHGAGLDLLHVLAVAAGPTGRNDGEVLLLLAPGDPVFLFLFAGGYGGPPPPPLG